jgi:hypothetical protein
MIRINGDYAIDLAALDRTLAGVRPGREPAAYL